MNLCQDDLLACGLSANDAAQLWQRIQDIEAADPGSRWQLLSQRVLSQSLPVCVHRLVFERNYAHWSAAHGPPSYWFPDPVSQSNVGRLLEHLKISDVPQLQRWSCEHRAEFWRLMAERLGIVFRQPYHTVLDLSDGPERPQWFAGARLNIADSCLRGDQHRTVICEYDSAGLKKSWTMNDLARWSAAVAAGLRKAGAGPGDAVGLIMPVTAEAVAMYLGIIRAGCVAVCVAESFAPEEIERRMNVGSAKLVFTCDFVRRHGKRVDVYARITDRLQLPIVVTTATPTDIALRSGDLLFQDFLDYTEFDTVTCDPDDALTILFSSGTTGDAKAIVWSHTTPIKCVADGFLYQDIQPTDIVAWPTSMGWMMGPWLIYATLVNGAVLALFDEHPGTQDFCRFVEAAGVTILGVIPSLVAAWRSRDVLAQVDWSRIRLFTSTGECSHTGDMFYLTARSGYKPIIEYCGGTELAGGYAAGTVLQSARLGCFTTGVFGLRLHIRDEDGAPATRGEVFIEPPAIGLSTRLLNAENHEVYYEGTPRVDGVPLRRHGDEVEQLPSGDLRVHGRCDDTMNLGGIKVSSVEIERVLNLHPSIRETAAVAVPRDSGGPDELAVFAVLGNQSPPAAQLRDELQQYLREHLNPLFKISVLRIVSELPRTASNKILRRQLRKIAIDP